MESKGTVAEWLGRGLQNLLQQFESARYLKKRRHVPSLFLYHDIMATYSRWIALSAFVLLAVACFLPWTFHADIQKTFTGFYTEKNIYGRPAKFLLIFGGLSALFAFIPKLWLKRTALFMSGLNVAYGIKTFLMFGACYQGYCPEKKIGLFLMLISTILLMIAAMFPAGEIKQQPAVESISVDDEKADTYSFNRFNFIKKIILSYFLLPRRPLK